MLSRLVALLSLPVICWAYPAGAGLYNAESTTLDNGLQIVVVPIHRTPVVTHSIWYRAGSADEPEGVSGTAHYLEHLLFKATPNQKTGEFSEKVRRVGGNDNAFTSWDITAYHQTVPKAALPDMMRMEASRMTELTPTLAEIETERQIVIEERRQVVDSNPASILGEKMRASLFGKHPYGRPIIGWMDEMTNLKWVDALAYYRKHYNPANAVVIISGDTTLAEVLPMAQATYGNIAARPVDTRTRPQSAAPDTQQRVSYASPNVRQTVWQYMVRVPSERQDRKQALALNVLADLLSGATGKLYQDITVTQKLATAINAGYGSNTWDDGTFGIYATPAQGVEIQALEDAVFKSLNAISDAGISQTDVSASISRLQDAAAFELDSLSGPAFAIGFALTAGQTLPDIENWSDAIGTVTVADVNKALKNILAAHGVVGLLLPQPANTDEAAQ